MESMATTLVTSQSERRNGVVVRAASAKAAFGVGIDERVGEECSDETRAKVAPRLSNPGRNIRAEESSEGRETGAPEPARRLAARADRLNMIRAVKELEFPIQILAWQRFTGT